MNLLKSFRKVFRFFVLISLIFCIFSPASSYAQEGQAIGRVLSTTGSVTARDMSGASRALSRRSDIFVGDTVITGPNGFAQLRMVDSAQISFKEDTEFTFSEYSSDGPGGAADSALMEMVRGGFRTISGTIGDDDADDYEVSTQFASIGIRGTTHEAVIDAGALLTGVYDGGTTISNGQGSLDTGEGANFDYSQTFPGQAPQGLLQQPAQLGNINLNGGGNGDDNDGDDGDDGDGDNGDGDDGENGDGDDGDGNNDDGDNGDDGANGDGDNGNADNNNGDENGGIADANDEEAGTRDLGTQQSTNTGGGLVNSGGGNTNVDPTLDPTQRTETDINPVINVRTQEEFEETGTGSIATVPDPSPPAPDFIQPSTDFLALVANSGFNTDFSLSELQGVTGRFSEVLAFDGLADIGGTIGAAAVGDSGPTTAITALTMSFDLDFSANLAQVSNGFLGIKLDDAPTPIAFNIFFSGDIIDSQSNFTLSSNSNRVQGSQSTAIDLQTSFLNSILVDDGVEQALFSDFFFEDTQGLGVEGQALVGFASPVLSPADNARISDRIGFVLSRNAAPGAIFPGNVTELVPGQEVILAGNDLSSPFTLDDEPPYIFRGAGSFIDFTDGTVTEPGEKPYDFEIGIWGSASNPVNLFDDFVDNSIFEQLTDPLIVVSVDPAPLSSLTGEVVYMSNFDRVLGGSSAGAISDFFTAFNVDFSASLITDGFMEFCLGGGASCLGENAQFWDFDFDGAVANGFVIASPVDNQGRINGQLASIFGFIEGAFTGDDAEAFVGGFNLYYDDDLDVFRSASNGVIVDIPDTTVDGVFLVEKDLRLSTADFDTYLDDDAFLVQEGYARTLLGYSRPTLDQDILFVDSRSRPRLVLTDPANEVSISNRNQNLPEVISDIFGLDWERWEGPLTVSTDNLDLSAIQDGANDLIHDIAFFSTFRKSHLEDVTGTYNRVFGFIGEDGAGNEITEVAMSFDINFSTSFNNVQNGVLDIYLDTPDENWLVFFEGNLVENMADFEFFDIYTGDLEVAVVSDIGPSEPIFAGIYLDDDSVLPIDFSDSNMQGVILDNDSNTTPALLSSFYFRELTEGPGRSLTGQALVAREDPRFNMILNFGEEEFSNAIVNAPYLYSNDILSDSTFDEGSLGLNSQALGLSHEEVHSLTDLYFFGLEFGNSNFEDYDDLEDFLDYWCEGSCWETEFFTVDLMQNIDEHVDFAHFDESTFMLSAPEIDAVEVSSNDNTFNLDMGYWQGTVGLFEKGIFDNYETFYYPEDYNGLITNCGETNLNCFGLEQEGIEGPAFWLNYTSFYAPNLTGRFSEVLEAFGEFRLTKNNGDIVQVAVDQFMADLLVDFGSSDLTGFITATSASNPNLSAPLTWSKEFQYYDGIYNPDDTHAIFTLSSNDGTLSGANADSDLILDLTGPSDFPILVGSIQSRQDLSAGGSIEFASIFAAQETRVGIVVESADAINPGGVFLGTASRPTDSNGKISTDISPRIGLNFDVNGQQDLSDLGLNEPFNVILTGLSTVSDATTDSGITDPIHTEPYYYDLPSAWGYWESDNMTIIHNEMNSTLDINDDILWATIMPANPADLTGTAEYFSSYQAIGFGTAGGPQEAINNFSMSFEVNFGTGSVTNGVLQASLGSNDGYPYPDWHLTFDGTVSGAFAEMGNYTNMVGGGAITGDIKTVFTNTDQALSGFSLQNSVGDYLNGISFFDIE